ncbi:unnamed protein product [Lota lota]
METGVGCNQLRQWWSTQRRPGYVGLHGRVSDVVAAQGTVLPPSLFTLNISDFRHDAGQGHPQKDYGGGGTGGGAGGTKKALFTWAISVSTYHVVPIVARMSHNARIRTLRSFAESLDSALSSSTRGPIAQRRKPLIYHV